MATSRNVLVTGGAGFIGSHLTDSLLKGGDRVTVLDNFNDFYDPAKKRDNIAGHLQSKNYKLFEGDIRCQETLTEVFAGDKFDVVVHLAAMACVRPSLDNPSLYMDVNVTGTQRLLERVLASNSSNVSNSVTRFVLGSSSSVYGNRSGESFQETDRVDQPLSPYAASKAANEMQCFTAHHTRGLPVVALRFFTVFGPRQRPDLAIHKFCKLIDSGKEIEVYGDGSSKRDYTFVSDIVAGIEAAMSYNQSGYEIINLGRCNPIVLTELVKLIEKELGTQAKIKNKPFQSGDMPYTYASIDKARRLLHYEPQVSVEEGIHEFVKWYKSQKVICEQRT